MRKETPYTQEFWDALQDNRFLIHSCTSCDHRFFPPSPICPYCHSTNVEWVESTSIGTLYSFTKQYVTANDFEQPAVAGVVELDDGPMVDTPIDESYVDLSVGDRVEIAATDYQHDYDRGRFDNYPFFTTTRLDEQ